MSLTAGAENLGAALGHVAARVDAWKKQREEIAADLQRVLQGLFAEDMPAIGRFSAGKRKNKGGRPKGYKMSEETKRKLRAAWKRRKAAASKAKASE
jgi:hypothetical protein